MRRVVLYTLLALDGEAEAPDRYILDWDDDLDTNLAQVIAPQDAVLLGRRMYDEWSEHWPSSDMEPFAPFINSVHKYVFTSTPTTRNWSHTTVVSDPAEAFVADLKRTDGGVIGVHGSLTLAQSLLRAGLIDELRLVVAPVTTGTGRRLFENGRLQRWQLTDSKATPSGAMLLQYRRRAG